MTFLLVLFCATVIFLVAYWLRKFLFHIMWFLLVIALLGLPVLFLDLHIGMGMISYSLAIMAVTCVTILVSTAIVGLVAAPLLLLRSLFKRIFGID